MAYIEKMKLFTKAGEKYGNGSREQIMIMRVVNETIEDDVEKVKRGEWLDVIEEVNNTCAGITFKGFAGYKCSLCGRQEIRKEPYCHCGAKMDGRSDTE